MAKSKMRKYAMPEPTDKVVIAKYIRVSTDKQREEGYDRTADDAQIHSIRKGVLPDQRFHQGREHGHDGAPQAVPSVQDARFR